MFCQQCGAKMPDAAQYCPSCGRRTGHVETVAPTTPLPPQPPASDATVVESHVPIGSDMESATTPATNSKANKNGSCGTVAFVITMVIVLACGLWLKNIVEHVGDNGPIDPVTAFFSRLYQPDTAKKSTGGITLEKYQQIENGMSYSQVVSILGRDGVEHANSHMDGVSGVMPSIDTIIYMWQNGDGSNMSVTFQNDKVVMKAQAFLK